MGGSTQQRIRELEMKLVGQSKRIESVEETISAQFDTFDGEEGRVQPGLGAGDVSQKQINGIEALEVKVSSLEKNVGSLCERQMSFEKVSRRLNVVIGNVEEKGSDIEDKAEIVKFMAEKFQVEVDPSSVSRLGRNKGNKCRLALVALRSFVDKVKVLKNAKILKGSRVFVSPDFNKEERALRKQLVGEMKKVRKEGKKAFLHHWENRLFVDGAEVEWVRSD